MIHTLSVLPPPFWVLLLVLACGVWFGFRKISSGLGLPILAVLGTVAAWYAGDALYNDYAGYHARLFTSGVLSAAWWQAALFCSVFVMTTPVAHRWLNRSLTERRSQVLRLARVGVQEPGLQEQLRRLFFACAWIWLALSVLAVARLGSEAVYYFFPFLGYRANPWARGRVGTGIDSLLVVATYLHVLSASCFGMVAALARNGGVRWVALAGCALSWPYIFLGATRNYMLTACVPAIGCWVLLRLRWHTWLKVVLLALGFAALNVWLSFVIANRSTGTMVEALQEEGVASERTQEARHEGLNMFEELCWINTFLEAGAYEPNWGQRYLAELVNPIPRALWKNKPMIGIDYAVARGQARETDGGESAGVYATISTGMIGQGVVNFGRWVGPAFAALLMAVWAAMLARLDLTGERLGRIPLYGLGLVLTFNLGRDITLITLYPFVFGALVVKMMETGKVAKTERFEGRKMGTAGGVLKRGERRGRGRSPARVLRM